MEKTMLETLNFLVKHKGKVLFTLLTILIVVLILMRASGQEPLLFGIESFEHLSDAKHLFAGDGLSSLSTFSLILAPFKQVYFTWFILISIVLSYLNLYLFLRLSRIHKFDGRFTFFFAFFTLLTPVFMHSLLSLEDAMLLIFLLLAATNLWSSEKLKYKYFAILPLLLISLFEFFTAILAFLLAFRFAVYLHNDKKKKSFKIDKKAVDKDLVDVTQEALQMDKSFDRPFKLGLFFLGLFTLLMYFLRQTHPLGRLMSTQDFWSNLVSDLGGIGGISVFILILALIGGFVSWRNKELLYVHLFLLLLVPAYFFNNAYLPYLALCIIAFASVAFLALIDRQWNLQKVKHYTLLLLVLSIIFSSLTFVDRVPSFEPSEEIVFALEWLDKTPRYDYREDANNKFLNIAEAGAFIEYFTDYEARSFRKRYVANKIQELFVAEDDQNNPFSVAYTSNIFPILERGNIRFIYIDPLTKERFGDADAALIFSLRNENFKLLYGENDYELWLFRLEEES